MTKSVRALEALAKIKKLKESGITLFPGLSPEQKAQLLYIADEPVGLAGFTNPNDAGKLAGENYDFEISRVPRTG